MNKKAFVFLLTIFCIFILPEFVLAKDVIQALRATENKASQIMMGLAPIAIMISAAVFQFSKQLGTSLLVSSCIGSVVFAGKQGIFDLLFGIFR